jgi:hypothetical protein
MISVFPVASCAKTIRLMDIDPTCFTAPDSGAAQAIQSIVTLRVSVAISDHQRGT